MADDMQQSQIALIKEIIFNDEYQEDFVNYFFDRCCKPRCGVECNDHYMDGPEYNNMAGCLFGYFSEKEIIEMLHEIKNKIDDGHKYECCEGWKN